MALLTLFRPHGSINVNVTISTANVDLTALGYDDWADYAGNTGAPTTRKLGGGSLIGNIVGFGGGTPLTDNTEGPLISWSDGTPTASATNIITNTYLDPIGVANLGGSITFPADTRNRTVRIYCGIFSSSVSATPRIIATLSDGLSVTNLTWPAAIGATNRIGYIDINYVARIAGQTLTVSFDTGSTVSANTNVWFNAALVKVISPFEQGDTAAGSGTVGSSAINGTIASTEIPDSASSTGTISVTASVSVTENKDSAALTGSLVVSGTISATELGDRVAGVSTLSTTGTISSTEQSDSVSGTASAGSSPANGSVSVTEQSDSVTGTGGVTSTGLINAIENADGIVSTANVSTSGSLTSQENNDTAALTGLVSTTGTISVREQSDTAALTAITLITGTLSAIEQADSVVGIGIESTTGTIAVFEDVDTVNASASIGAAPVNISGSIGEDQDSVQGSASAVINGIIGANESIDQILATGNTATNGTINALENNDNAVLIGNISTSASISVIESQDSAAIVALTDNAANGSILAISREDSVSGTGGIPLTTVSVGNNTTNTYSGTQDTGLNGPAPNTNQSANTEIQATKYATAGNAQEASLIRFTGLSSLPAGAVITSATIVLTVTQQSPGLNSVINVNRSLVNWDVTTATWNQSSTGTPWNTAGSAGNGIDRVTIPSGSVTITPAMVNTQVSVDVTQDVIGMASGALQNNGWLLERALPAFNTSFTYFGSAENIDSRRPFLLISYYIPPIETIFTGSGGGITSEFTRQILRARRLKEDEKLRELKALKEKHAKREKLTLDVQKIHELGQKSVTKPAQLVKVKKNLDAVKQELANAEQRLIDYLEQHEKDVQQLRIDEQIIQIIAEWL